MIKSAPTDISKLVGMVINVKENMNAIQAQEGRIHWEQYPSGEKIITKPSKWSWCIKSLYRRI